MKSYNLETALKYPFKTTHLYLHGLKLEAFPEEVFYFPNLKYIDISWNKIKEIPAEILKLEYLEGINLSENYLTAIPAFLNELTTLQELDFSKNQLPNFPLLDNLKALRKVNFSYNQIQDMPRWVGKWKQLEYLDISYNEIRQLPASIGAWTKLQFLFAQHNLISNCPNSIKNWTNSYVIHLEHNRIGKIPAGIGHQKMLQRLHLEYNRISEIHEDIGACTELQRLTVQHNRLSQLPESITKLRQLQILQVSKNKLSLLPENLGNCSKLIRLEANTNQLIALPASLSKLRHLQDLQVSKNRLSDFPPLVSSLRLLHLSRNPMRELPAYFWKMNSLEDFLGLEHLFPSRLRKRILEFKKTWLKAGFETDVHPILWAAVNGKPVDFSVFSNQQLFQLLALKSKHIKTKALQELTKHGRTESGVLIFKKQLKIAVLGRTKLPKSFWKKHLGGFDIDFQSTANTSADFIIVGTSPKNYRMLLDANSVFISEKDACLQVIRLYQQAQIQAVFSDKEKAAFISTQK